MGFISVSGIGSAARTRVSGSSVIRRTAAGALLLAWLPGAMPVADLHVDVTKLRSSKGMLRLCLTADPKNFPACIDDARAVTRSVPATQSKMTFAALPTGDYAIAVIHDENDNHKLDTLLGIPREGFGFSRNPAIGFGPPRFAAARFALASGADAQQVRMKYML
jgi:uncharacterized protein (DUF2141 family)